MRGKFTVALCLVLATACEADGESAPERTNGATKDLLDRARCSSTPVPFKRANVRAIAFPRGEGPVFVGLGTAGVVHYTEDTREEEGWYYYKTLWAISPTYAGPVSITGHQVSGSGDLRFNAASGFPGTKDRELHFAPDASGKWRYGPSDTLIRAPGCYAFVVAGRGFKDAITFSARP